MFTFIIASVISFTCTKVRGQIGPFHISLDKMGLDKMGLDKMGLDKMGLDKMGLDKVGMHLVDHERSHYHSRG